MINRAIMEKKRKRTARQGEDTKVTILEDLLKVLLRSSTWLVATVKFLIEPQAKKKKSKTNNQPNMQSAIHKKQKGFVYKIPKIIFNMRKFKMP
jgi:hypothetical protein